MDANIEKKALSIVRRSGKSIIGSIDSEGFPNVKAMLMPRRHDGLRVFYFTTNTSSMRVKQYRDNPKAAVYFFNRFSYRGLLLKGAMEVREDQETKNEIWRLGDRIYYPKGVTDSDYCVLKFTAEEGRIYEKQSSASFKIN
jgi:general stress protein 26